MRSLFHTGYYSVTTYFPKNLAISRLSSWVLLQFLVMDTNGQIQSYQCFQVFLSYRVFTCSVFCDYSGYYSDVTTRRIKRINSFEFCIVRYVGILQSSQVFLVTCCCGDYGRLYSRGCHQRGESMSAAMRCQWPNCQSFQSDTKIIIKHLLMHCQ